MAKERKKSKPRRKAKQSTLESLNDIQIIGDQRFHTSVESVDELERRVKATFPTGYREFIARFGEGVLSTYVRVYPPQQLLDGELSIAEWRKRIKEYWFWDAGKSVLAKSRALKCVLVADTLDGDEVIFHPSAPDRLFVLPRHDEVIYVIDGGLLPALQWLLGSGTLTDPIAKFEFEPFDSSAPRPQAVPIAVAPPSDLIAMEPIHARDGSILCRVYRFGPEHQSTPWDGRSRWPTDMQVLVDNALIAGDTQWGQTSRITDLKLYKDPPHFVVRCEPVSQEWGDDRLYSDTIYLDLAGTVIAPTEHSFKNHKAYEKFSNQVFGR